MKQKLQQFGKKKITFMVMQGLAEGQHVNMQLIKQGNQFLHKLKNNYGTFTNENTNY